MKNVMLSITTEVAPLPAGREFSAYEFKLLSGTVEVRQVLSPDAFVAFADVPAGNYVATCQAMGTDEAPLSALVSASFSVVDVEIPRTYLAPVGLSVAVD